MTPLQGSGRGSLSDEGRRRWAILALLFFCRTSLGFQFQTMGSAAPGITAEIGLSLTEIGTLIGLFMLPGVFLSIPSGYAARYMSDKGLLVLGLLVMGLGGATAAVAAGFGMLALARILCGIGFVKAHQVAGKRVDFIRRVFADQVLVQALEREFAGTGAGTLFGVFQRFGLCASVCRLGRGGGHGGLDHQPMRSSRLIISTATRAASRPFSS